MDYLASQMRDNSSEIIGGRNPSRRTILASA